VAGVGRSLGTLPWYATSVSTSRPPSPTLTGLLKSKLYYPNFDWNRTLFRAIEINSYHPKIGCVGTAVLECSSLQIRSTSLEWARDKRG
jgi:hypothetical protein